MLLALGVSLRIFPLLERHLRADDCGAALLVGELDCALPVGGSDLVAHSEHEGGVDGCDIGPTAPKCITR